jgi:hypothetical protein
MKTFAFGDTVTILTDAEDTDFFHGFTKGDVGVVIVGSVDGFLCVKIDDFCQFILEKEISK